MLWANIYGSTKQSSAGWSELLAKDSKGFVAGWRANFLSLLLRHVQMQNIALAHIRVTRTVTSL